MKEAVIGIQIVSGDKTALYNKNSSRAGVNCNFTFEEYLRLARTVRLLRVVAFHMALYFYVCSYGLIITVF